MWSHGVRAVPGIFESSYVTSAVTREQINFGDGGSYLNSAHVDTCLRSAGIPACIIFALFTAISELCQSGNTNNAPLPVTIQ